jgi:hypothetical protein
VRSRRDDRGGSLGAGVRRGLILFVLAGLIPACGYQPLEGGAGPQGPQKLHVTGVTNDSLNPWVQAAMGSAIIRQVRLNTRIRMTDEALADVILSGRVLSYQNDPITFSLQDIGRRYRVRVLLLATLTKRGTGAVQLKQEITGEAYYNTGTTAADTRAAEQEATQRAAQDAARQLVALLVEEL